MRWCRLPSIKAEVICYADDNSSLPGWVTCFVLFSLGQVSQVETNQSNQWTRSEGDRRTFSKGRSWIMVGWRKETKQFNSVLLSVTPFGRGRVKVGGGCRWARLSQSLHKRKAGHTFSAELMGLCNSLEMLPHIWWGRNSDISPHFFHRRTRHLTYMFCRTATFGFVTQHKCMSTKNQGLQPHQRGF